MRPSNRLRRRLMLLYCVMAVVSGAVLLALAAGVAVSLPGDAPAQQQVGVPAGPGPGGLVQIAGTDHLRKQLLLVPGIALLLMVPISLAFGWYIAGRMLRPIRTMTDSL